jgi:MoxR-like ATPase
MAESKPSSIHTPAAPIPGLLKIRTAISECERIILGKQRQIHLAMACFMAQGHLLIEDVPGVGKTTLAHTLAQVLGLEFQRIQFTSDLMPADITGGAIYDRERNGFSFHAGPLFTQMLLADEINRATPKTQSALLEAMEERQVTVDGRTYRLPEPFFVIATQNPNSQGGTFILPESQLDRFLMRISLGYPDIQAERALLQGLDRRKLIVDIKPLLSAQDLLTVQREVMQVHVAEALLDYALALIRHTRESGWYQCGLSPRAGLALIRCAQAWALLDQRRHVLPEDVQAVFGPVVNHRLQLFADQQDQHASTQALLHAVPVPD